ncbi:hypothetical protein ACLE20_04725 [Rhizobium sp. YIM 134829]|uniref:hypothetical protein n=1 Tax=Rhizobium sp. YIM 134829 TaxID=3390453 RepID=UPI0039792E6B
MRMTPTDIEIERDAWHFWFDETAIFLGSANGLSRDRVDMVIRHLEAMDPTEFALMAKMKPAKMAEYYERALTIYSAVSRHIQDRLDPNQTLVPPIG